MVIEHYVYDAAQTQQAWSVYDDARTRALAYLASRQPTCDAISGALEKMRKSGQPYRADEFRKLERKLQKLMAPVERIFEESLKPRVERLATRTQRDSIGAPAKKP